MSVVHVVETREYADGSARLVAEILSDGSVRFHVQGAACASVSHYVLEQLAAAARQKAAQ